MKKSAFILLFALGCSSSNESGQLAGVLGRAEGSILQQAARAAQRGSKAVAQADAPADSGGA